MPRRYYTYIPEYQSLNRISSIGAFLIGFGFLIVAYVLIRGLKSGTKAPANPWGGKTLEWQIPSPPPHSNFDVEPVITEGPYEYK